MSEVSFSGQLAYITSLLASLVASLVANLPAESTSSLPAEYTSITMAVRRASRPTLSLSVTVHHNSRVFSISFIGQLSYNDEQIYCITLISLWISSLRTTAALPWLSAGLWTILSHSNLHLVPATKWSTLCGGMLISELKVAYRGAQQLRTVFTSGPR